MTEEGTGCGLQVAGCGLRVTSCEFQDEILASCNSQLVTSRSHLQLVIRLSVENEKFFVVVSRIGPEG
jgi:hypothetical protein